MVAWTRAGWPAYSINGRREGGRSNLSALYTNAVPIGPWRVCGWLLAGVAMGYVAGEGAGSALGLSDSDRGHCALFGGGVAVALLHMLHTAQLREKSSPAPIQV